MARPQLLALALIVSLDFAQAAQHVVGESAGWTIPAIGDVNYSTWADDSSFHIGDTVLFEYEASLHNVVQVTQGDYDNCSAAAPQASFDDGSTIIKLDKAGIWYFICGFPGHCLAGQKVALQVTATVQELAPAVAPSTAPNTAPTPARSLVPVSLPSPASAPLPKTSATFPTHGSGTPPPRAPSTPYLTSRAGHTAVSTSGFKITTAILSCAFLGGSWLAVAM